MPFVPFPLLKWVFILKWVIIVHIYINIIKLLWFIWVIVIN